VRPTGNQVRSAAYVLRIADGGGRMENRRRPPHPQSAIRHRQCRHGFTLIEAVISTVIVAVMFVAALNTVGASRVTQLKAALVGQGRMFAEALMTEILQQSYQEPEGAYVFGRETGELAASRAAYDDVDDYHGWTETSLTDPNGTALPNAANWKRTVTVEWIDPAAPEQVSGTESGAKRIKVVAAFRNVPQATIVGIRTVH